MQSFLHFEKSQVHASRCAVLALVVGSLGMGLSFEMDGACEGGDITMELCKARLSVKFMFDGIRLFLFTSLMSPAHSNSSGGGGDL